jgi:hypothetical protein
VTERITLATATAEVIPHVVLHTPYVPRLTVEEAQGAFRNIVATFSD